MNWKQLIFFAQDLRMHLSMNSTKLVNTLAHIVGLLSQRAFDELFRLDQTKRLLPDYLAEDLDDYGGHVTLPPSPGVGLRLLSLWRQRRRARGLRLVD